MAWATEVWAWNEESFIKAWEAGVFGDQRVEMIRGEVWPVSMGPWHGAVASNVQHFLRHDGWRVTMATLPAAGSLPDPDAWVLRRDAEPVSRLGETRRLVRWSPTDVVLVVEVSDTSFIIDTEIKAKLYGAAAYPVYWVVHPRGVVIFTDPYEGGYRQREEVGIDGTVRLPYATIDIAVRDLLDAPDE